MHGLDVTFAEVARHRAFDLVAPTAPVVPVVPVVLDNGAETPVPRPAPYVTLRADLAGTDARLTLASGDVLLTASYDATTRRVGLHVGTGESVTTHRSRRFGRCPTAPSRLALTLTSLHLTAFAHDGSRWVARSRVDLRERLETRTDAFVAGLRAAAEGVAGAEVGAFGQLGLRDLRFVTTPEGEPVTEGDAWLLTATNAGPGFFDAGHTGVWSLQRETWTWRHRADLFFRRPSAGVVGVYGDHATHLVRDGDPENPRWLVATSTWGDLDVTTPQRRRQATVSVVLAESGDDLTRGQHVLDARPLPLPTDGLSSVATWDPHLVRDGEQWLVGFVSSPRLFRFHPAFAAGPSLDDLTLLAADPTRRATEGTTLVRTDQGWRVVASDGRDGRRGQRRKYPVFDLGLRQVGTLDAAYLTNLPWPALARDPDRPGGWVMVTFNGRPAGGEVLGYGTHGDAVVMRGQP